MASRLDQALDEVIKERRSERSSGSSGRRHNNNNRNNDRNSRPSRDDFTRRRADNNGVIRKRIDQSSTISSFVRTVNVGGDSDNRGSRNINGQWSHDMFDDDRNSGSIISRLGGRRLENKSSDSQNLSRGQEISVENLHYDVTEKDLEELFSTVANVVKVKLVFDPSGRSTGVAVVKYNSIDDAERAIKKYNNVELDGQAMKIELKEYVPRRQEGRFNKNRLDSRRGGGGRFNDRLGARNSRDSGGNRNDRNSSGRSSRDNNKKEDTKSLTAEDLDKEMDNYMSSNVQNEDTDMILD